MADPHVRDFQPQRARAATGASRAAASSYSAAGDIEAQRHRRHSSVASPPPPQHDGAASATSLAAIASRPSVESIGRRPARQNTVRHYSTSPSNAQPWEEEPGAEPGVDTRAQHAIHKFRHLQAECQTTLVDFSEDHFEQHEFYNRDLLDFLAKPRPEWAVCRWMNINGISFDVISQLQRQYNLHRLAIEDLMESRSRTKADWYANHAFMSLTLQKLVRQDDGDDDGEAEGPKQGMMSRLRRNTSNAEANGASYERKASVEKQTVRGFVSSHDLHSVSRADRGFKTLQRYRGSRNLERAMYMERHSALTEKGYAVNVEQVSIFLTNDNTVISFFEHSADDIEEPILKRLKAKETILRQSCDASMMLQAVIDAVIDLAIPVIAAYEDIMANLELDVLTDPDVEHSKSLYILSSELSLLRNSISPITSLVSSLRDHRSDSSAMSMSLSCQGPS